MADGTIMKPQSATDMAAIAVSPDKTVTITGADDGVLIRVKRENGALKSMNVYKDLTFTNSAATLTIQDLKNGDELMLWNSLEEMKLLAIKKTTEGVSEADIPSAFSEPER